MITKIKAIKLIKGTSKYKHALFTSVIMSKLATSLNRNVQEWELVGLLHDLDIDEVKSDMSLHGVVAAEMLEGELPEMCLYAIRAHDFRTGFKPKSKLDKALIVADSLAILLEKADRKGCKFGVETLKSALEHVSLRNPWNKSNILICEKLGLTLEGVLKIGIEAYEYIS